MASCTGSGRASLMGLRMGWSGSTTRFCSLSIARDGSSHDFDNCIK